MKALLSATLATACVTAAATSFALSTQNHIVRWPYAVVPYQFGDLVSLKAMDGSDVDFKRYYENGMRTWEQNTSIRFVNVTDWTDAERAKYPRILMLRANDNWLIGCRANVGYLESTLQDGRKFNDEGKLVSPVTDTQLHKNCVGEFISNRQIPVETLQSGLAAAHELGHAIGFIHEHQRHDRDDFLFVSGRGLDFDKAASSVNLSGYDYLSIMHYYPWQGGEKLTVTIPPNDPAPWSYMKFGSSLDAPAGADAAAQEKSAALRAAFPNFESRLHNRLGLSEVDKAAFAKFYASDIADLAVDNLWAPSFCSDKSFNEGKCSVKYQARLRSDVANLGPFDSGRVTITHVMPSGLALSAIDLATISTTAETCGGSKVQYCADAKCNEFTADKRLEVCATSQGYACESRSALVCSKAATTPIELIRTEFTVQAPDNGNRGYAVAVSGSTSRDDRATNNGSKQVMIGGGAFDAWVMALLALPLLRRKSRQSVRVG